MVGFQGVAEELTPLHPPLSGGNTPPPLTRGGREGFSVGIIGGGYAGMAAAVSLAARGIPVTVFESAPQLGGRARGVLYNDTQIDNGQHLLLGCYRETLRLIELVGGNIEKDFLRLPLQLDLHGQFSLKAPRLPAPLHLLVALLSADGISFNERLKAARFMLALRKAKFQLDKLPDRTTSHSTKPASGQVAGYLPQAGEGWGEGVPDITVAELLTRYRQDADLTLKLWEPLCIAALNTPIYKASAQVLLNVLRDALNQSRADSDMLLPQVDFTALFPQRAAAYVEQRGGKVFTSCGVEAIVPVDGGFEITTSAIRPEFFNPVRPEPSNHIRPELSHPVRPEPVEGTNGASIHVSTSSTRTENESQPRNSHRFTHVICAASPTVAARLLRPIAALAETVSMIDALEHQPIYTIYLQYLPAAGKERLIEAIVRGALLAKV